MRFRCCWTVTRRRACASIWGCRARLCDIAGSKTACVRVGVMAVGLEARVRDLEAELRRVERERDILKKALSIFGRDG